MSQRVFSFIVVLLLFFNGEIFAQKIMPLPPIEAPFKRDSLHYHRSVKNYGYNPFVKQNSPADSPANPINFSVKSPVSMNFYSTHLSFFCNQELKLEKATSIPFRFRLGSLDYVNYLEQKPNAVKPR
jgi:hypothetical protein